MEIIILENKRSVDGWEWKENGEREKKKGATNERERVEREKEKRNGDRGKSGKKNIERKGKRRWNYG